VGGGLGKTKRERGGEIPQHRCHFGCKKKGLNRTRRGGRGKLGQTDEDIGFSASGGGKEGNNHLSRAAAELKKEEKE